ncbi:glycoside hydrolase family 47 protein [Jaapia argillacea MUCL 33604]|uniref:alpha-1,2-Mannosidase n=1 Tax=Jaapia argillacea MUCL 33604 TaxID=933084 RepID=A0A067Q4B1_9AGAM|nr:glycoside hydrolase family 47 protein [Jaapia argillacea MUCL 33604]
MIFCGAPAILLSLSCALQAAVASGANVQKQGLTLPSDASIHQATVKQIFTDSYEAYRKYAFGHDDVSPVSMGYSDGRNGWGASIIDAMSTMVVMGLNDYFDEAVNFTSKIDFSKSQTPDTVSVFETTIRYVGGLLSSYELSSTKYPVLIQKAKEVADKLVYAWVGVNDIPFGYINFTTNSPVIAQSNIAEAGTLTLEFATLSKYTGNDTYRQLAEKAARHIAMLPDPLPGLAGQGIDPSTGLTTDGYVTWGGGSDSYFEYLIKYPRLTNTDDPVWVDTWKTAVDSSIKYLLKTSTVGNWSYLADYDDNKQIRHIGSHLACFHAGNWLLGGKLLNNDTIVDIALELADACWNTYASTATGIGPEVFGYYSSDGTYTGETPSASDITFYDQHGFFIYSGASDYILRPEVLESNFYAWRVTGNTKYLDNAASAIASFETYLKVTGSGGYAGISDVNNKASDKIDDTESFWFAEVLKYLYLTFDDPNHISLDNYVFNTECHPFIAASSYTPATTGTLKQNPVPFTPTGSGQLPQISPNPFLPISLSSILGLL